jgi:hypothetical protein
MSGENTTVSTRGFAGRTIFLLKLEEFRARVFFAILFVASFICRNNVIVHPFIEFLYYMVSISSFSVMAFLKGTRCTHLEFRGNSEFNTQLFIENCSRKSLTR